MIRKYRRKRVSESRSPRRRMMKESYGVYDLIDYFDVWGNEEDGWDVNDLAKVEEGIYIDDSLSDEEIVDYLIDEVGFFSPSARGKIEVDSSTGDFIEFFNADTYEPLGRLERTRTVDESYKRIDERHEFRHKLPNNPTDYERFVNYVESLILACENVTNAAEVYLRRVEDNEDFYNDPSNERWYDYEEKTEKVAKMIKQLEKMKNTILNRVP